MPIYEYQCQSCGHRLEKLQRMSDDPLRDCPSCEQPELRRLVSAAAFRLKGGGWYETDFKKDGKKNLHDSGNSKPDTPKSDTAKADSASSGTSKDKTSAPSAKPVKPKSAAAKPAGAGSSSA